MEEEIVWGFDSQLFFYLTLIGAFVGIRRFLGIRRIDLTRQDNIVNLIGKFSRQRKRV